MGPTDENESLLAALSAAATAVATEPASLRPGAGGVGDRSCYHHDPAVPANSSPRQMISPHNSVRMYWPTSRWHA